MSSPVPVRWTALCCAFALSACGGGGGGNPTPPAPPPPPVVDATPPETTVSGAPAASTDQRTATFTLSSSETGSTFEASLDGAAYVVVTSPYALTNLADGSHTLNLRARDAANNVDASPVTVSWMVDGTPPNVRIVFPGNVAITDAANIRLRGTAQDSGTIASLTVNGSAAVSTDGFRNWTATVNVATGSNTYAIVAADSLGNTSSAASVAIVNRGVVASKLRTLALDSANNRLLATDWELGGIVAFRTTDGVAQMFSDASHGTGTNLSFPSGLVIDAPRNRVLTYDGGIQKVLAIDLTTGNRSELSSANSDPAYVAYGQMTYHPANNHAYVTNGFPAGIVDIDLTADTRSILSSNSRGTGPAFVQPSGIVLDTSAAGGGTRLLVSDVGAIPGSDQSRLIAVDLATGNRTVLSSSAAPAVGSGQSLFGIGQMQLDAANNRVLVMEYRQEGSARLFEINLATGARTRIRDTGVSGAIALLAIDSSATLAYLGHGDRARVLRAELGPPQQIASFAESLVGGGAVTAGYNSLELDTFGSTPSLIAGAQTLAFGGAAAVFRIDIATGERTVISGSGVGTGSALAITRSVQFDRRNGGTSNLFAFDPGYVPTRLFLIDIATGGRISLSSPAIPYEATNNVMLDPVDGRLLTGMFHPLSSSYGLVAINSVGGALDSISLAAGGLGTGPAFNAISAIGIESPAGGSRRYIVATINNPAIFAVDPTTGNRTILSGFPATGSGPPLLYASDMDIDSTNRRALVLGSINNFGSLQFVDLTNGSRSHVSGLNPDGGLLRGTGPAIAGTSLQLRADFARDVAYVVSNSDSIVAVDLVTGDRAIISR